MIVEESRMEDYSRVEECIIVDANEEYALECHLGEDEESPYRHAWYITLYKAHPSGAWSEVYGACYWDYENAVEAALDAFSHFVPRELFIYEEYDEAMEVLEA